MVSKRASQVLVELDDNYEQFRINLNIADVRLRVMNNFDKFGGNIERQLSGKPHTNSNAGSHWFGEEQKNIKARV